MLLHSSFFGYIKPVREVILLKKDKRQPEAFSRNTNCCLASLFFAKLGSSSVTAFTARACYRQEPPFSEYHYISATFIVKFARGAGLATSMTSSWMEKPASAQTPTQLTISSGRITQWMLCACNLTAIGWGMWSLVTNYVEKTSVLLKLLNFGCYAKTITLLLY